MEKPTPRKKSQKRQRSEQIKTPLTKEEFNDVAGRASAAGLSHAAFSREAMLGYSGARSQRRAPVDAIMFRQYMGQNNQVGNNFNQISRNLHMGDPAYTQIPEFTEACLAYVRVTNAILELLGKQPMDMTGSQPEKAPGNTSGTTAPATTVVPVKKPKTEPTP